MVAQNASYLPHIAEGIDSAARQEFLCLGNEATSPNTYVLAKQTAIVHGVGLKPEDIAKFRATQTGLIWSPRSNIDLYGDTAPVVLYDNLGVQIALGTDWLASGSMNMARELQCADDFNKRYLNGHFSDRQLWQMVTSNAASAVGGSWAIGALRPGYLGDIAIFSASSGKDYRAVIASGVEDVMLVLRGGKVLYGDASLLDQKGLGTETCEPIDVCGSPKKACIKGDLENTDLQKLLATQVLNPSTKQKEPLYPLFFCKGTTPKDEPTCTPSRPEYTGAPSSSDKDGDGVADAADNCPAIFNPIRPLDDGAQGDADRDGIGDACDACPLEKGETCKRPSSDDLDNDGIVNDLDNCPETANADQKDDDTDGKGNACDTCPQVRNLGQASCSADATPLATATFTVKELRDPADPRHPKPGTVRARVSDLFVTAVRSDNSVPLSAALSKNFGFFAQTKNDGAPAPYSGIFIDTGDTRPDVAIGNKVEIEGDYAEVDSISMLRKPAIRIIAKETTLPFSPVVLSSAVAAGADTAKLYQSMLIAISNASVSNANPDGSTKDYDEFTIKDASGVELRVDDALSPSLDNKNVSVDQTFSQIIGIAGFSFRNHKIFPRSEGDLKSP